MNNPFLKGNTLLNGSKKDLSESERYYRTLIHSLHEDLLVIDRDFRITDINNIALKTLGKTRQEVIGRLCYKVFHGLNEACDEHGLLCPLHEVFDTGEPVNCRHEHVTSTGTIVHVDILVSPIKDSEGNVTHVIEAIRDISDLFETQKALQKNEAFLSTLLDAIPAPVFYKDKDGRYLGCNKAFETFFGVKKKRLIGKTVYDIHPLELAEIYYAKDAELFESGGIQQYESQVKNAHNELRDVIFNKTIFTDSQGAISGQVGAILDITERKQVEETLRASEERLQLAADAAQMGQWDWNIVTGEVVWSQQCLALYGLSPDIQMSYDRFLQALHPEDRERVDNALHRAVEDRTSYDEAKRTIWPDGSIHWTASRGQVYCDATGQPIRMIGVTFDITKWKEAEEAIKVSEARYMDLYENAPDMYASVNAKTALIEECNMTLANILGYSKEEIIGRPVFDIYHPDCLEEVKETFKLFVKTGEIHDKELQLRRKDGSKIDVSLNVTSVRDKNGHILFSRSTLRDITERKQAEADLRQSEARYRTLYNNTPVMLHSINREGRLISVSDYWLATLGYTRDEVLGRKSTEFLTETSRRYATEVVLPEFMQTGHCHNIEYQFVKKNGDILDCLLSAISERDADGQILRSMAVISDITDRKRSISVNMSRMHLMQFAATHSLDKLLEETLNEAEKLTDSLIGFYHFVEDDQKSLTLQNWSTKTKAEFCKAEGKGLHYAISDAGVWVDCVYQRKPVIHNDYISLPHRKGMPQGHAEVIRELIVPVLRGNKIKAILGVGNKPIDYTETDVEAISLLAELAWEIAERKQAEEKMIRSDQRLRLHSEQSPLGFLEWDDNFRAIEWNAACERIFGYTREEAIGRYAKDLILPLEVYELVDEVFNSLLSQTGGEHSINKNVTKDGRIIICEWFNTTLINEDGKAIGVASVCRDITKQKRIEEELEKYREHLEELVQERTAELEIAKNKAQQYLDIAGVILVAIDAGRRVTLINQKGCEVLGGAAGEIIGKDWFETFIPANIRQDVIKAFHRLMAGEIEPDEYYENPVLTQDGQERLIAWHNSLLRDDGGNIVGTLSSGEDITEHKQAENQIRRLNQNLRDRAVALEAANKELEAFAYSVSHDLRAPLRHIDGFMELLQKRTTTSLDERSRHYMDTISGSAKRMGTLIDDLLSFSQMSRNQMSYQNVDLGELTQEIIREFETVTKNRNIHWCLGDLPVVTGDLSMLRTVLVNLISNALKFTRPVQQAEIEIGCMPDTKTETIIFVRDNGVGFDMNYVDKLFSVFQRLHRVDEFEGTGIGLANVRRIIARHGGRTWAKGKFDQGAIFYFSLPQT